LQKYNPKNTVIVTVEGGVAEFFHVPEGINVLKVDWDNMEGAYCPVCNSKLDEFGVCTDLDCLFDTNLSSDEWLEKEKESE
jgi:hypothetical protein